MQTKEVSDRKQELEALSKQLMDGVLNVMNSDGFKAWLDTSSRLFANNLSFNNTMHIFSQKPDATYCMGYEAWKQYGRNVASGAKGASYFKPVFAHERQEGDFFRMVKKGLEGQLKDPSIETASFRIGSRMDLTLNRAGIWGLRMDGRERSLFGNEFQVKRFIQSNVLDKVPMYYAVGKTFDIRDTITPEFLWMKSGFKKDEVVTDENGRAIKNKKGEYKVKNTPERIARFMPELGSKVIEQDPEKMGILLEALKSVSERNGVPVREAGKEDKVLAKGASGYFSRKDHSITLYEGLAPTEKVTTLFHEMGHADLHGDLDKLQQDMGERIPQGMKEVQAESVAYAMARHFGIDTDTSSFEYIAGWSNGTQVQDLAKSLEVIYQESNKLLREVSEELRSRGRNLDLSEVEGTSLSDADRTSQAASYVEWAIAKGEKATHVLETLPLTASRHKGNREILDNLAQQMKEAKGQQKDVSEVKSLASQLVASTDRIEQDATIEKLERMKERIFNSDQRMKVLQDGYFSLFKDRRRGYDDFIRNPEKAIAGLKEAFPKCFEGLSALQVDYIAKSSYVREMVAPLLILEPTGQRFAEEAAKRAEAVGKAAARNGSFVEIISCEKWTSNPIVESGTIAHPNVADSIIRQGEAEVQRLRKEAEDKEVHFPYAKCHLTVFAWDVDKKELIPFTTRMDIGNGFQTSLSTFLRKEMGTEAPTYKAFDTAILEEGVKEKVFALAPLDPNQAFLKDTEVTVRDLLQRCSTNGKGAHFTIPDGSEGDRLYVDLTPDEVMKVLSGQMDPMAHPGNPDAAEGVDVHEFLGLQCRESDIRDVGDALIGHAEYPEIEPSKGAFSLEDAKRRVAEDRLLLINENGAGQPKELDRDTILKGGSSRDDH